MELKQQTLLQYLVDHNCWNSTKERQDQMLSYFSWILLQSFNDPNTSVEENKLNMISRFKNNQEKIMMIFNNLEKYKNHVSLDKIINTLNLISQSQNKGLKSQIDLKNSFFTLPTQASFLQQSNVSQSKTSMVNNDAIFYISVIRDLINVFQDLKSVYFEWSFQSKIFILKNQYQKFFNISETKWLMQITEIGFIYQELVNLLNEIQITKKSLTHQSFVETVKNEILSFFEFLSSLEDYIWNMNTQQKPLFLEIQFFCQKHFDILIDLLKITREAQRTTSAELLSRLYLEYQNSIYFSQGYQQRIFFKSARGFIDFINNWIFEGEIMDPFNEFFVQLNPNCLHISDYWFNGLQFKKKFIPVFLDNEFSEYIWDLGKVLRLLKKINMNFITQRDNMNLQTATIESFIFPEKKFQLKNSIYQEYQNNTNKLIYHIFEEKRLWETLDIIQGIYLTEFGDIVQDLLISLDQDIGLGQLKKGLWHQLNYCLENSLQKNSKNDKFKEQIFNRIKCKILDADFSPEGLLLREKFQFLIPFSLHSQEYETPLNYFLNKNTIEKYMKCFRFLLTLKTELYQLDVIWKQQKEFWKIKENHILMLIQITLQAQHSFHNFFSSLLSYFFNEIISKAKMQFQLQDLQKNDFGELIQKHDQFIDFITKNITFEDQPNIQKLFLQILELSFIFKQQYQDIFSALRNNTDQLSDLSIDSIDQNNAGHVFALNEEFIKSVIKAINNIQKKANQKILDFVINYKEGNLKTVLDSNDFYYILRERKLQENEPKLL